MSNINRGEGILRITIWFLGLLGLGLVLGSSYLLIQKKSHPVKYQARHLPAVIPVDRQQSMELQNKASLFKLAGKGELTKSDASVLPGNLNSLAEKYHLTQFEKGENGAGGLQIIRAQGKCDRLSSCFQSLNQDLQGLSSVPPWTVHQSQLSSYTFLIEATQGESKLQVKGSNTNTSRCLLEFNIESR